MNLKNAFLILCFIAGLTSAQENYSHWSHYKNITVNTTSGGANITANVTGFPLLIRLTAADSVLGALSTGADLRFTKSDGVTRLKHEVERWSNGTGEIWVLMDTVFANSSTQSIRMYWGHSISDSSSGSSVFSTTGSFLGVWHMKEASGDVNNSASGAYPGSNVGTTTASGAVGDGRTFNGTSQWITVSNGTGNAFDVSLNGNMTLSGWFNASAWTGNPRIFQKGQAPRWSLKDSSTGAGQLCFFTGNGTANTGATSPRPSTGAWHLVHGVQSGTTNTIYLDGVQVGTGTGTAVTSNSTFPAIIGGVPTAATGAGSTNLFSGVLDEMRIQTTARSANWARLDYETQKPGAACLTVGATVNLPAVAPVIVTHPANLTVSVAATARFVVVAGGTTPLTYKWVKNNTDTVGTNSDTLALTTVQLSDSGSYKVVVRNSAGQAISSSAVLTVGIPVAPSIILHPANQSVAAGGTARLTMTASGTAPLTYKWVRRNIDTVGTNSDTLTLANASIADTGSYKVVVRNTAGVVISNSAVLSVGPAIISQPANQSAVTGATAKFGIRVTGTSPLIYKWVKNNTDTLTAATDTLTLTSVSATDVSSYKCVVRNVAGQVISSSVTLSVTVAILPGGIKGSFEIMLSGSAISFRLPAGIASARISLMDVSGREAWKATSENGVRDVVWNGMTANGRPATAGVYLIQVMMFDADHHSIGKIERQIRYTP